MKTKCKLIRDLVTTSYDGEHSVTKTDWVEVTIEWPEGYPKQTDSHTEVGEWRILQDV